MMNRENKAFTLVELIIVIAVIGVLAAILIPVFSNVIAKANEKSALSDARNTISTVITEAAEHTDIPENILVFVKKADNWYLYGYDRSQGGTLQASKGNPLGSFSGIESINDIYGWDGENEPDFTQTYTFGPNRAFYLVPQGYNGSVRSAAFDARFTNITSAYDITRIGNENEVLVYHGKLLNGTFTFINDVQTASNLFPRPTGSPSAPSESPEPTQSPVQARDVSVTITDTRNGDSTEITFSMTGDILRASDIAENCDTAMPYFMADSESYTVSDDAVVITGTRLAKKNGNSYGKYTASGVKTYSADETDCYYVTVSEEGFMRIADDLSARYVIFANDNEINIGEVEPFGTFSGVLDGRNCTLKYAVTEFGLFTYNEGTIKNIKAEMTAGITNSNTVAGGFVGENKSGASITNVTLDATGLTLSSGAAIGGFCGVNTGTIRNCSAKFAYLKASGTVSVDTSSGGVMHITALGGFCGFNNQAGTITCCTFTGNVEPTSASAEDVGGFCGGNRGTITSCSANGNVSASQTASCVGGFVGTNYTTGVITGTSSSYSTQTGNVSCINSSGYSYVGGFVGCNKGNISYAVSITENEIAVSLYTGNRVGGFCGSNDENAAIRFCEHNSHVLVTGTTDSCQMIGGFCGTNSGTVASCKQTGSVFARSGGTSVNANSKFVGGFAGEASGGEISLCEVVRCALLQGGSRVGGFVGAITESALVTECTVTEIVTISATETSTGSVGGFAGRMVKSGVAAHCNVENAGTINGIINVGGFVGYMNNAKVLNCNVKALTAISATSTYIGGFAGHTSGSAKIFWSYVKATSIDGGNYLGGFIGYGESSTVKYSYARINNLNAAKKSTQYTCGFCGRGDGMTISDCYIMVLTSGYVKSSACGFMYGMVSQSTLTNCYCYMAGVTMGTYGYRFARTTYVTCNNCFYAWTSSCSTSFQSSNQGGSAYSSGGDNRFGTEYWDYSSNYATLKPYQNGFPTT